ncbi:MAG: HAD family phosphatase [Rhodospirillaceae bacterium]|nr:HAD family phosphatase [Rhodospirillaceae bacterium]
MTFDHPGRVQPPDGSHMNPTSAPTASGTTVFRAVLWDLDGTLIDTERVFFDVVAALCAGYGHRFDTAANAGLIGREGAATCDYLIERFDLPLSREALGAELSSRFLGSVGTEHARTEAVALVRRLAARGVPQACVSNSPTPLIRHHLGLLGIEAAFACIVGRDEVARGKPHPDPYLLACRRLGLPAEACLAVEDTPTGVAAARAAGVTVIACPTELTAHLDFTAAHHRVERLAEFPWSRCFGAP